ncbi:MAG: hypothetical protein ABEJ60_04310 [Halodesulfurarchaeum sp.]
MSSNRSSRLVVAALLLAVVAAGPAAAVTVSSGTVPPAAEVGSSVDVTYTFTDLYTSYDRWTLTGETELTSVTWTVTTKGVGGEVIEQVSFTGHSFSYTIAKSAGVATVTVRVQGTVPEWSHWSYQPPQSLTIASFDETQSGGAVTNLTTSTTRPYTEASQAARTAIEEAQAAIDAAVAAGADVSEAKSLISNAISAYNAGNFQNAQDLAQDAKSSALAAKQSSQRTRTLMLIGGAVVVLALIGGAVYWYLSNRDTYDKLG